MSNKGSLYKVVSTNEDFSSTLQVRTLYIRFKDRYDRFNHKGSRWLARAYTASLRRYLSKRPHIDYKHKDNWARKLSYIPSGFRAWAEYMPGGFATYYVYEPYHKRMANGMRLDGITKRLFRHGIEGSGIRNRAYVLSYLVNQQMAHGDVTRRWLSIGCGTGQPTFDAAKQLPAESKAESEVILVDKDEIVLDFAKSLYDHQAAELPRVKFRSEDILSPNAFDRITGQQQVDIVDIYGMFEYLDDRQSVQLLSEAYGALREGGMLIFSNMDVFRPDYDINQRVIGWPALILRSPKEMLQIITDAGIVRDEVRFIRTQDEINNIFEVVKK